VSASLDSLLVRAPIGAIYRTLTDVDGWPLWWRGCVTTRVPAGPASGTAAGPTDRAAGDQHRLVLARGWSRRPVRMRARAHGWRHDLGMHMELEDLRGHALASIEWWLEASGDGTIVHRAMRDARTEDVARWLRRGLALGMQDLKDHLELAVALALGREP
jgi:uncharacterized protein YndB with AHSA1/START domain